MTNEFLCDPCKRVCDTFRRGVAKGRWVNKRDPSWHGSDKDRLGQVWFCQEHLKTYDASNRDWGILLNKVIDVKLEEVDI